MQMGIVEMVSARQPATSGEVMDALLDRAQATTISMYNPTACNDLWRAQQDRQPRADCACQTAHLDAASMEDHGDRAAGTHILIQAVNLVFDQAHEGLTLCGDAAAAGQHCQGTAEQTDR